MSNRSQSELGNVSRIERGRIVPKSNPNYDDVLETGMTVGELKLNMSSAVSVDDLIQKMGRYGKLPIAPENSIRWTGKALASHLDRLQKEGLIDESDVATPSYGVDKLVKTLRARERAKSAEVQTLHPRELQNQIEIKQQEQIHAAQKERVGGSRSLLFWKTERRIARLFGISPVVAIQDRVVGSTLIPRKSYDKVTEDDYIVFFKRLSTFLNFDDIKEELNRYRNRSTKGSKLEDEAFGNLLLEAKSRWFQEHTSNPRRN